MEFGTRKIISFLFLLALCVNLYACSVPLETPNTTLDIGSSPDGSYRFSYTVVFEFTDIADVKSIEDRITAFEFHVKNKEVDGNKITYVLKHNRVVEEGFYDLLCTKDVVSIEDTEGNVLLTRADVSKIQFYWKHIIATVSASRYTELIESACCFVHEDKHVPILTLEYEKATEENVVRFSPFRLLSDLSDENYVIFLKGAINLMSPPLKGKVSAEVLASKKRLS